MVEFKLFGIPVRVEVSFWITLGLLGFISFGVEENGILKIALFVLAAFLSILIHEMGHALMIKKYRLPTQIVLAAFGGFAQYPAGYLNRKQDFLVTLAGPAIQLACGLAVYLGLMQYGSPQNMASHFIYFFMSVSIFWAILNCLPILPLDGGRMMAAIMGPKRARVVFITGIITSVLVGFLALAVGAIFGLIFMGMFAYQNFQLLQQTPRR